MEECYNSIIEQQATEQELLDYHTNKENGNWFYAKTILKDNSENSQNTVFLCDYFEKLFEKNNDCFDNITTVFYKGNLESDFLHEFEPAVAKHFIDNFKIPEYKPDGYVFSSNNSWAFKIVVVTKNNIYAANKYINKDLIGFY